MATYEEEVDYTLDPSEPLHWFLQVVALPSIPPGTSRQLMWHPYGESLHASLPLFLFFTDFNIFFGLCTVFFTAAHMSFSTGVPPLGTQISSPLPSQGFVDFVTGIGVSSPLAFRWVHLSLPLYPGTPRSIHPEFLPRDPTVFSLLQGTTLGGCSCGCSFKGFKTQTLSFLGSCFFPNVGTGLLI
jgi:hypothetical protein